MKILYRGKIFVEAADKADVSRDSILDLLSALQNITQNWAFFFSVNWKISEQKLKGLKTAFQWVKEFTDNKKIQDISAQKQPLTPENGKSILDWTHKFLTQVVPHVKKLDGSTGVSQKGKDVKLEVTKLIKDLESKYKEAVQPTRL